MQGFGYEFKIVGYMLALQGVIQGMCRCTYGTTWDNLERQDGGNGVWGEGGIGSLYYINIELTLSDKGSLMT